MTVPAASVVIRVKNEAEPMRRTLGLLAGQTIAGASEIVVVDSGSTDGTLDVVRATDATLIEIPPESFTYGGSLNTGTERARSEVVVALSAHSYPKDAGWLERMVDAMSDPRVCCASGQAVDPRRRPLAERMTQDIALARANPQWGYSSHAGAFRRSLWEQRPFRTDMSASEDKEWAWHWLEQGWLAVFGPDLTVDHSHGGDPPLSQFRRARNDWTGMAHFVRPDPLPLRELVDRWWRDTGGYPTALRARLSHKRAARLLGDYVGRLEASRRS